jgi:plasmid stabilization system protein ParE
MARLPIDYHPAARLEAIDAFNWYRERSVGAAGRFQNELEKAQLAIQRSPDEWAAYIAGTRRYLLKRYPYLVVYRILSDRIEFLAISHARREPGYWVDRLLPSL